MSIRVVSIAGKIPAWVNTGCEEYSKRLSRDWSIQWQDLALAKRGKNTSTSKLISQEGESILTKLKPNDFVVDLAVEAKPLTTEKLAQRLDQWRQLGRPLVLLIGGPDGLSNQCKQRADASISLSALTLPHPLVRILLAEQLYRAWSILHNHPYHK